MLKSILLILFFSLYSFASFSQRLPVSKSNKKSSDKQAKRDKINELIRNEEEGIASFKKQSTIQFKMNNDGNGFLYEYGKMKTPYKTTLFQFEYGEKQHPKQQKQSTSSYVGGGFTVFGKPFIYGKQNIFYQLKLGAGQQILIGGKGNKNGVAISGVLVGGFSAGLTRPYYMEFVTDSGSVKKKFSEADRELFMNPENIIGGTGLSKGWNELTFNPGVYAKTGLRFDWARFNQVVSALEFGFSFDFYSKKVVQMVDVPGKSFFPTAYISLVFGKRK
jgi:hypothetical protein